MPAPRRLLRLASERVPRRADKEPKLLVELAQCAHEEGSIPSDEIVIGLSRKTEKLLAIRFTRTTRSPH